jgi:hypothetical protein
MIPCKGRFSVQKVPDAQEWGEKILVLVGKSFQFFQKSKLLEFRLCEVTSALPRV